jgi:hypothetical protein
MKRPFQYPDAGARAPAHVRQAILEYARLPAETKARVPLLYWLLGSGTPPYKMAASDAEYGAPPDYHYRCGNCKYAFKHLSTGAYICSQIRGRIELNAWCRLWAADTRPT